MVPVFSCASAAGPHNSVKAANQERDDMIFTLNQLSVEGIILRATIGCQKPFRAMIHTSPASKLSRM